MFVASIIQGQFLSSSSISYLGRVPGEYFSVILWVEGRQ